MFHFATKRRPIFFFFFLFLFFSKQGLKGRKFGHHGPRDGFRWHVFLGFQVVLEHVLRHLSKKDILSEFEFGTPQKEVIPNTRIR